MWHRLNLFWRYFLAGFACIVLAMAATSVLIDLLQYRDNKAHFTQQSQTVMQQLSAAAEEQSAVQAGNSAVAARLMVQQYVAEAGEGFPFDIVVSERPAGRTDRVERIGVNRFAVTYTHPVLRSVTLRDRELPAEEAAEAAEEQWLVYAERLAWLFLIVLFLGSSFYWISRRTARHMRQLLHASQAISQGRFDTQIPLTSPEPIRQLAQQLNTTRDNIKGLIDRERVLALAIPHELRTPLSKMRLVLDLSRDCSSVAEYETVIEDMDGYVDELQELVNNLLTLTQHPRQIAHERFSLAAVIEEAVSDHHLLHPELDIRVRCHADTITTGKVQLQTVLNNLLRNACACADHSVYIEAGQTEGKGEGETGQTEGNNRGGELYIVVANDGQTIPEAMRERIFDPFVRLDAERERRSGDGGAAGLGLALVRQAVQQAGGSIAVTEGYLATGFRLTLPVTPVGTGTAQELHSSAVGSAAVLPPE